MAIPKNHKTQPIKPDAGYAGISKVGQVGDEHLRQFLDYGKGIGSQLGYETILPGKLDENGFVERCKQPGGFVALAPVKGEKRSTEKVNADYNGDWSKLLDIARATIAVDSVEEIHQVLDKMRANGVEFAKQPKDRITTPPDQTGYRDIMTNVVMPNGCVCEIQVHLKPMLIAKAQGHHQYEVMRSISAKCSLEKRDMSPEEQKTYDQMLAESQKIYGDAWKQCTGESNSIKPRLEKAAKYAKRHTDAKGQKDLFTGEVRAQKEKQRVS